MKKKCGKVIQRGYFLGHPPFEMKFQTSLDASLGKDKGQTLARVSAKAVCPNLIYLNKG